MARILLSDEYIRESKRARPPEGWRIAGPADYKMGAPLMWSSDGGRSWDQGAFSEEVDGCVSSSTPAWYSLRAVPIHPLPRYELHEDEGG